MSWWSKRNQVEDSKCPGAVSFSAQFSWHGQQQQQPPRAQAFPRTLVFFLFFFFFRPSLEAYGSSLARDWIWAGSLTRCTGPGVKLAPPQRQARSLTHSPAMELLLRTYSCWFSAERCASPAVSEASPRHRTCRGCRCRPGWSGCESCWAQRAYSGDWTWSGTRGSPGKMHKSEPLNINSQANGETRTCTHSDCSTSLWTLTYPLSSASLLEDLFCEF